MSFPNVKGIIPGAFTAMNMSSNTIAWRHRYTKTAFNQTDASCESGSLTTAGGLVFVGLPQGMYHGVVAYNAATGARLWRFHTDAGVERAADDVQRRRRAVRRRLRRRSRRRAAFPW